MIETPSSDNRMIEINVNATYDNNQRDMVMDLFPSSIFVYSFFNEVGSFSIYVGLYHTLYKFDKFSKHTGRH